MGLAWLGCQVALNHPEPVSYNSDIKVASGSKAREMRSVYVLNELRSSSWRCHFCSSDPGSPDVEHSTLFHAWRSEEQGLHLVAVVREHLQALADQREAHRIGIHQELAIEL